MIDTGYDSDEIARAIHRCLNDEEFKKQVSSCVNPYGAGNAGPRVAEVLATVPMTPGLVQKRMTY